MIYSLYFSSCNYLVDNHDELDLICKLLCDLFNAWSLINMRSRQLLCRFLGGVVDNLMSLSAVEPVRDVVKQVLQSTSKYMMLMTRLVFIMDD